MAEGAGDSIFDISEQQKESFIETMKVNLSKGVRVVRLV